MSAEECLAHTDPKLLEEWDYKKNKQRGKSPENITRGSSYEAAWVCKHCGYGWDASVRSRAVCGTGCKHCCHVQTSRTEKHIYLFFREILPNYEVIQRDKKAICKELDIYIPELAVAFEPGAWYFHQGAKKDLEKKALCDEMGIRLFVVIENCGSTPRPEGLPENWRWCKGRLFDSSDQKDLIELELEWASELGIEVDPASVDWERIAEEARKLALRMSYEDAIAVLLDDNLVLGRAVERGDITLSCVHWAGFKENSIRVICNKHSDHISYETTYDALRLSMGCRECSGAKGSKMRYARGNTEWKGQKCVDHEGNSFESISAKCQHFETEYSTYHRRKKAGCTEEEALTGKKAHGNSQECYDHLSNEYESFRAMAAAYGLSEGILRTRLEKLNWPLEKALTAPLRGVNKSSVVDAGKESTTEYGPVCSTDKAMNAFWGMAKGTIQTRLKMGWTAEQAFTGLGPNSVEDHMGARYRSKAKMAAEWGITKDLLDKRLKAGWSLEEALTGDRKTHHCFDHLGNEYESLIAMLRHYGLSRNRFWWRLDRDWSLERALTGNYEGPEEDLCGVKVDHMGRFFPSQAAMCDHWKIGQTRYRSRLLRGWTVEDALTTRW